MTDQGKLPVGQILALATLGLVGSLACVGLVNTARWAMGLPPEADLSALPASALLGVAKLALQFLAGITGFLCILFGNRKVALFAAISAVALLLALHIASWVLGPPLQAASFLAKYGLRVGFALWLIFVLIALVPNKSFKPKPLRGSA
jgi:hypothetical protein